MEGTKNNVNGESYRAENQPKKCFCARCFTPICQEDKVTVGGQNFHRECSRCCVCHEIPKTLKMFCDHVFCEDCFKTQVLNRFKDQPEMTSNSWWMQWAPGVRAMNPESTPQPGTNPNETKPDQDNAEATPAEGAGSSKCKAEEPLNRCYCARCLQTVNESNKVIIDGQTFHPQCCSCCFCRCVPKGKVKIYYGQMFCEECFNRFVMARNNAPAQNHEQYFKTTCEQWNNKQFAESMREFMNSKSDNASVPIICMAGVGLPQNVQCGPHNGWFPGTEPRKCEQTATPDVEGKTDLPKNHAEASEIWYERESANHDETAAKKIEKLTKYFQPLEKSPKKWKNCFDLDEISTVSEQSVPWVNLQNPTIERDSKCPKCLWQCGPINVIGACLN